jgi:hypothetical protein
MMYWTQYQSARTLGERFARGLFNINYWLIALVIAGVLLQALPPLHHTLTEKDVNSLRGIFYLSLLVSFCLFVAWFFFWVRCFRQLVFVLCFGLLAVSPFTVTFITGIPYAAPPVGHHHHHHIHAEPGR